MGILIKKNLCSLIVLFCAFSLFSSEALAEDGERRVSTAASTIQYASQKIAKSYFYKELDIRYEKAVEQMKEGLAEFDKNLPTLQQSIQGKEQKGIMKFLLSSYEQLKKILPKPFSKTNGAIVIDASESLFEAAGFLAEEHLAKERTSEQITLGETQRLLRQLERINKYYIAHHAGIENNNNVIQLRQAVATFETGLSKVTAHAKETGALEKNISSINKLWPIAKDFYLGVQQRAQPVIVLAATDKLIDELLVLEKHHQLKTQKDPQQQMKSKH
jgi:hypothetical protein